MHARSTSLILVLLVACSGDGSDPTGTGDTGIEQVDLVDVGTACAYGDGLPNVPGGGETTTFAADGRFDVQVVLDDCASGCAGDVQASCDVRLVTGEVVVTAEGSYTIPSGSPDCPAMCVEVVATCAGEPLEEGPWTLDYRGGHSDTFDVPGTVPVPCAEPR